MRGVSIWAIASCVLVLGIAADEITLKNGDRISGIVQSVDSSLVIIKTQ